MKARRKSAGLVNPENLSYTGSVPLLLEPDSTHRLRILSRRHMGPPHPQSSARHTAVMARELGQTSSAFPPRSAPASLP